MALPAEKKQLMLPIVLGKNSKAEIAKHFNNLTLEKVTEGKYPSLTRIKNQMGVEKPAKALAILIIEFSSAFGDELFDKDTALELSYEIVGTYGMLSLEDCYTCLKEMKSEKQYGKLNANKVMVKLKSYLDRKLNHAERLSISRHMAGKFTDDPNRTATSNRKAYQEFRQTYLKDEKREEYQTDYIQENANKRK